jgi:hypothetical protein
MRKDGTGVPTELLGLSNLLGFSNKRLYQPGSLGIMSKNSLPAPMVIDPEISVIEPF